MKAQISIFRYSLLLAVVVLIYQSCQELALPTINIDPEFQPYVDEFIEQAALRGIDIDFEETGMSIQFDALTAANANGICYGMRVGVTSSHEIVIHRNNWKNAGASARERLIFHELGHCYLYRAHTNDTLANGDWKSMLSGPPWPDYKYSRGLNYSNRRKEYYIDELFNPNITAPEWSLLEANYEDVQATEKDVLVEMEGENSFFRSTNLSSNFELELNFSIPSEVAGNSIQLSWGGFGRSTAMTLAFSNWDLLIYDNVVDYGLIRRFEFIDGIHFDKPNKLTVRKQADIYYYFLNEHFIYWSDYSSLESGAIQLETNGRYDGSSISLKVFKIPD